MTATTFPVFNRRSLVFGIDSDLAYALLASGIWVYSHTDSNFTLTVAYLAALILLARQITGKDPDQPLYALKFVTAPTHWDAGK